MSDAPTSVINIDDEQIKTAVKAASRRILVMAPGLTESVAMVIAEKWTTLAPQSVNVILDVDPEVCRLGYGEVKALSLLQSVAKKVGATVHHQKGLRIGLVVADDTTLIYSPTPLVVEAKSAEPTQPNGIRLDFVPQEVAKEVGLSGEGSTEPLIGKSEVSDEDVQQVVSDLAENPPRKFDITQKVQVFNAAFEFVEFKLEGCLISKKRVRLPSDLVVAAKDPRTQKRVNSNFNLIDDDNERLSGKKAMHLKESIANKFLVNLPGYGNVVLRANKADFERAVKRLILYVELFQKRVETELQKAIEENRKTLVEAFLPAVTSNPPERSIKLIGRSPDKELVRKWLDTELTKVFGSAKSHMSQMEVSVIFKGVTYESLNDPKFVETAQKHLPTLKQLHEEFETAKAVPEVSAQESLFPKGLLDESSKAIN